MRGLAGPLPMTVLNCRSRSAARRLREILRDESFDTVQVEGVHLLEYLPAILQAIARPAAQRVARPAVVVDWHNIESECMRRYAAGGAHWAKRLAARRTALLLERVEDRLLDAGVTHTVTSEREHRILQARRPAARVHVIPNGIDAALYSADNLDLARRRSGMGETKSTLLFVGSMDYHANIDAVLWFARAAWPQIACAIPDLQFTIVGRNPAREIRALASQRIRVTGTVDDVRPYYANAAAAVVPIRVGGGTRLKILEAMAAGVPVISTSLGAEGLEMENGTHLLLADSASQIAAAVQLIVSSAGLRADIIRAARLVAGRKYDWASIGEKLFEIHQGLGNARRAAVPEKAMAR